MWMGGLHGPLLLEFVLVREVVADDATRRRAEKRVVMGKMPGYAAHHRALYASLGVRGPGADHKSQGQNDRERFHGRSFEREGAPGRFGAA
jgi:hypothetical protein